jgi:hypothetical protein
MSSYEFLELIEQMPDRGRFKTAARGGNLCQEDEMLRHLANEVAKLRATMHAVHGGKAYSPKVFMSVSEQEETINKQRAIQQRQEDFFSFADRTASVNGSD